MGHPKNMEDAPSVQSKSTIQGDEPYKHDAEIQLGAENNSADISTKEEAPRDPNVVGWDGPDDPANPMNWSSRKKFGAIGIVSLITMLS